MPCGTRDRTGTDSPIRSRTASRIANPDSNGSHPSRLRADTGGRNSTDTPSAVPGGVTQCRPSRPRPDSATRALPSGAPRWASARRSAFVDPVSVTRRTAHRTDRSLPIPRMLPDAASEADGRGAGQTPVRRKRSRPPPNTAAAASTRQGSAGHQTGAVTVSAPRETADPSNHVLAPTGRGSAVQPSEMPDRRAARPISGSTATPQTISAPSARTRLPSAAVWLRLLLSNQ